MAGVTAWVLGDQLVGEEACPFTTLYWDFLDRNRKQLEGNRRMTLTYRNLDRIDPSEREEIQSRALGLRRSFTA